MTLYAFTVWAVFAPAYSSGETILEANPEFTVRVAILAPLLLTSTVGCCCMSRAASTRLGRGEPL